MNRGILLGIILTIGLIGYIVFDSISFSSSRPEIYEMFDNYVAEFSDLVVTPKEHQVIINDENPEEIMKEREAVLKQRDENFKKIMGEYWGEKTLSRNSHLGWNSFNFVDLLTNFSAQNKEIQGYITKYSVSITDKFSIRKSGPGIATANIPITVIVETNGNIELFTPVIPHPVPLSEYYYHDENGELIPTEVGENKTTIQTNAIFTLMRIDGKWKIITTQYQGYSYDSQQLGGEEIE